MITSIAGIWRACGANCYDNEWRSAVDANDVPFFGDAGAPEFLVGVVGLAGGEEEGGH